MDNKVKEICIDYKSSILSALRQMDEVKHKLLIVTKNEIYFNLISIGDIQRAIIKGIDLACPICDILRNETTVARDGDDLSAVKDQMQKRKNEFMPIINENGGIEKVIFWEDLFSTQYQKPKFYFDLPIVIMAGGKGTRLRPLTNILPKPLIPIGEKTMLEDIMDRFVSCGSNHFYISVNYKANVIKRYLDSLESTRYNVDFFQEDKPLGTAGSLHLLKGKIDKTFFVSNCDIIIDEDYSEILKWHRENRNEITIVAAIKNISVPYGTLETGKEGLLKSMAEKPEFTFKINTGMYILEPHLISEIPENEFYHITFLIEKLCKQGRRVGVYPINDGSWTDIGNWREYIGFIPDFSI